MKWVVLLLAIGLSACASSRFAQRIERVGLVFVSIPGGEFEMGDPDEGDNPDAKPLHTVFVTDFALSRYETTFHQYDRFAEETQGDWPEAPNGARDDRAVVGVSWDEAVAFCAWIGGRLPTEQEWEYAAAGGAAKQRYAGTSDPDSVDAFVRHRGNGTDAPGIVGRKRPSLFGLYDLSGNVAEWVADYYQYYPEPGVEPAFYDLDQGMRIVRGGSYSMAAAIAQTHWRAATLREVQSPAIGFRCARD